MKDFIIGLAVGALGAYIAIKLSDEETRDKLGKRINSVAEKAREDLDYGLTVGKSKALRAGVKARQEYNKGKEMLSDTLADWSDKVDPAHD